MKNAILLAMLGILCSCDNFFEGYEKHPKSPCEQAINRVMARNAKSLGHEFNMHPCAITVGMPGGNIKYLELQFQDIGPKPKEEIRQILLNMSQSFLSDLNEDAQLRECLHNKKLNINEIGVTIFFHDKKKYPINAPNIGVAGITRGVLDYVITDKKSGEYIDQQYETYQEALKLVNEKKCNFCSY